MLESLHVFRTDILERFTTTAIVWQLRPKSPLREGHEMEARPQRKVEGREEGKKKKNRTAASCRVSNVKNAAPRPMTVRAT